MNVGFGFMTLLAGNGSYLGARFQCWAAAAQRFCAVADGGDGIAGTFHAWSLAQV